MAYTAQLTDAARTYRERMLPGCEPDLLSTDPEFAERFANFAFDEVIAATPELDDRTRFMCWLATLLGCQGIDEFRVMLRAALNMGLEPLAIRKVSASRVPASFFLFMALLMAYVFMFTQFQYMAPEYAKNIYVSLDKGYQMTLIGSLSHGYPLLDPHVAGRLVHYHIFSQILLAVPVMLFGMTPDFL